MRKKEAYQKTHMDLRTKIFLSFLLIFFACTAYLTYYSKVVYLRELPKVEAVMPELVEGEEANGRYLYVIPKEAILVDASFKPYILTARLYHDIMGQRYRAYRVHVWIKEEREDGNAVVEGIIRMEPVIVRSDKPVCEGSAVALAEPDAAK